MLVGIDPLLRGQLLAALDEMGHGDLLVIADANFPAHRLGRRVLDVQSADAPTVLRAVASVFPIDPDVPVSLMASPGGRLPVQDELVAAAGLQGHATVANELGRYDFYDQAREASAILLTGELRPYGNVLLRKGVVAARIP